jgi:hypothetical protein
VVYADNDPIVLAHARALLTGTVGTTAYIDADLRDTDKILRTAAQTLDFSQPVGVMLIAVLHCIPDSDEPGRVVSRLMDAVPGGSYLAISQPAKDLDPDRAAEVEASLNQMMSAKVTFRSHEGVSSFLDGLDVLEPGVVRIPRWRPGAGDDPDLPTIMWGGVARKP